MILALQLKGLEHMLYMQGAWFVPLALHGPPSTSRSNPRALSQMRPQTKEAQN